MQTTQTSDSQRKDSTQNIHRRYRHLFTLPARNRTLVYSSVIVILTTALSRIASSTVPLLILAYLVLSEIFLLLSVEIDNLVLRGKSKVATFRRLISLSIVSNSFWLVLSIVAFFVDIITHDYSRVISIIILGAFFAIAFRALILGSLFYHKPYEAIPLSFVQPALLFVSIGFQFGMLRSSFYSDPNLITAIVGGVVALIAIEVYMLSINKIRISSFRPLELLQAFLNAWAAEDATNLERFLDATSKSTQVKAHMLSISSSRGIAATVIIPGIHPGPFYPIGSSNIPADIFSRLRSPSNFPMVVHSLSDHNMNLPSKAQVEKYVSALANLSVAIDNGSTMSEPVFKQEGKATVVGLAFGNSLLITITQAPYGMEDFPVEVREEIEAYSSKSGKFKNVLVVDTHNSEGEKPNEKEQSDAVKAAKEVIDELITAEQFPFRVGIAHSSQTNEWIQPDVGPAGIGLINFEVKGQTFSLVIVDSNNSVLGFREKVFSDFESKTGAKILELCTSDTHVTAAKTSDAKGYLALGDMINHEKLASILAKMYEKARIDLGQGSFSSSFVETDVKTIGNEILDDFSGLLDSASAEAKYGAQIIGGIAFLITVLVVVI